MNKNLYFIPLLFRALDRPNMARALRSAFNEIVRHSKYPRFRRGYVQFLEFMAAIQASYEEEENGDAAAPDTAAHADSRDAEEEAIVDLCDSLSEQECFGMGMWDDEDEIPSDPTLLELTLRRLGASVVRFSIVPPAWRTRVEDIVPGTYELAFASGRTVWEAELVEEDLLWAYAGVGQPLRLAADTGGVRADPSREEQALGGELTIRIYPGRESGTLEIELCTK